MSTDLGWFNILKMAVVAALFMTVFRCLGVLLHANAESLELPVRYGRRIEAEHRAEAESQRIGEIAFKLHQLVQSGQSTTAWDQFQKHLEEDRYQSEALYFAHLRGWDKPQPAIKAGQDYIGRLTERGEVRTAWDAS